MGMNYPPYPHLWPRTAEDEIENRIWQGLYQRADKYRAGKISKNYMIRYLVKYTNLNLFEITSLMKLIKESKKFEWNNDLYDMLNKVKPKYSGSDLIDTSSSDYDNVRKKWND